jgi:hypothetical protein
MASIGEAFIDVHANTDPFARELPGELDRAADAADAELNKTGQKIGDDVSDGIGASLKRRGKSFAKSIEEGTKNTIVRVRSIFRFDRIRDSIRRRFRRDVGDTIAEEIGDALDRSTRRGGVLSKLGQGFADAIGAGFNVSGRSPLIAILLPALAALVGVILAAVQAVNALVAVLFIVPGLLASIGLQVGVVAIAFQGIGTAVQGAFAAKNAKELRLALKDLTPSARSFVKELLPLRGLFKEIGRRTQEAFFLQLAGAITNLRKAIGPSLVKGFEQVAAAAGRFLRAFAELLSSPVFVKFFNALIPATTRWLDALGSGLFGKRGFITGLLAMATALMPFMEKFGEIILRNLGTLSGLIFRLAEGKTTQPWLDRMAATLQLVFDLLFNIGDFLFVFMSQLDKAGGANLITTLSKALMDIMFLLSSPAGLKGMEGLVNLGIIGIKVFAGLIEAVFLVLAAFQFLAEWLKDTAIPAIITDIRTLGSALVAGATFVGAWIERIVRAIGAFFVAIGNFSVKSRNAFVNFVNGIVLQVAKLILRIRNIPRDILNAIGNLGSLLYNAGRNLIQGLINGITAKFGSLSAAVSKAASIVAGFFGRSPAKEGPLSGQGWTKIRGQHMMQDLMEGIRGEVPDLRKVTMSAVSNIVFGSNSVQVNVAGGTPDTNQARAAGTAMGMSAANMIASRNTRLAVRTL